MSLTKLVNGVSVICSPEEEEEILSFWASNPPRQPQPQRKLVDQIINDPEQLSALKVALGK